MNPYGRRQGARKRAAPTRFGEWLEDGDSFDNVGPNSKAETAKKISQTNSTKSAEHDSTADNAHSSKRTKLNSGLSAKTADQAKTPLIPGPTHSCKSCSDGMPTEAKASDKGCNSKAKTAKTVSKANAKKTKSNSKGNDAPSSKKTKVNTGQAADTTQPETKTSTSKAGTSAKQPVEKRLKKFRSTCSAACVARINRAMYEKLYLVSDDHMARELEDNLCVCFQAGKL